MKISEELKEELHKNYGITDLELALDFLYDYRDYVADNHPQIHEYAMDTVSPEEE
jgi:hypothetical protein